MILLNNKKLILTQKNFSLKFFNIVIHYFHFTIKIKLVIIPIRDYKISANSRLNNGNNTGGLWNAVDELSQIRYYKDILSDYIYYMTKYELNTIFIDFDKMISDKKYLFNKIKNILDEKNIDFDLFCNVYDEVSVSSKNNF
jgi:hypothetical protein